VKARLFVVLTLAFLVSTSREPPWADAHVTYDTTQSLVDHFALDVHTEGGSPWFYAHRLGRKYGVFPLGNVVAMVPSYVAYKLLHHVSWIPEKPLFAFCCHLSPSLMMAGACVLFFVMLRRRGARDRTALGITFVLAFATQCFIYARSPYSEALQTLALVWLVERTLDQAERPTHAGMGWLGVAAGVLLNSKLVYALLLPPVVAYLVWSRRRALGDFFVKTPLAVVTFVQLLLALLLHNYVKTGSYLQSGYQYKEGVFSGDLFTALYGFIFSTGKGALYYSPPLILGILGARTAFKARRAETTFLLSIISIVVLFNAKFRVWHADYCWGPRYLTCIVPIVLLLAVPWLPEALERGRARLRRYAVGAVLAAGLAVQLLGASFYWDHYIRVLIALKDQTGAYGWFTEHLSHGHFIPEFSPIRGHAWMLAHLVRNDPELDRDAPWKPVIPQPANLTDAWSRLRLDWWLLEFADPPVAKAGENVGWRGTGFIALAVLVDALALASSGLKRRYLTARRPSDMVLASHGAARAHQHPGL
jgi:hypothetical protein